MSDIIDRVWTLAAENMDVLLVVGLVVLIQGAKRAFPRVPSKAWMGIMVVCGAVLAWISTPSSEGARALAGNAIKYAAGAELCYQAWRTLAGAVKSRLKGKG